MIAPVREMLAESMRLSPRFAAEYRGFWDLPEDFEFDASTPTVAAPASVAGKLTPAEVNAAFLRDARAFRPGDEGDEVEELPCPASCCATSTRSGSRAVR